MSLLLEASSVVSDIGGMYGMGPLERLFLALCVEGHQASKNLQRVWI